MLSKSKPNFLDFLYGDNLGMNFLNFLDSNGNPHSFNPTVVQDGYAPTVYSRVAEGEDGATHLQYYFHYLYNDMKGITGGNNNLEKLGEFGGVHEGDWEFMQIRLNDDYQPEAYMSSIHHHQASIRHPDDPNLEYIDGHKNHVITYAGEGGHPTYFSSGETNPNPVAVDVRSKDTLYVPAESSFSKGKEYDLELVKEGSDLDKWLNMDMDWGIHRTIMSPPPPTPGTNKDARWDNPSDWIWTKRDTKSHLYDGLLDQDN